MKHNFRKMTIWNEGIALTKTTYALTNSFPAFENYGLSSQFQRAAISIPSNIAEGSSKESEKYFIRYLEIALGSAFEWETQLTIAFEINYISESIFTEQQKNIQKLQGMIAKFIATLK